MTDHPRLSLGERNIDLWLSFYDEIDDARLLSGLRGILNDAERQQETRFYFADDRKRYLVTRAMVRTVLSRYAALASADWVFSTNAYGRPEIAHAQESASGLCFNISHTRGLIALGVCQHRSLGVDVENVRARQTSTGIADRFFSPTEVAELAKLAPERRQDRFFEYWTFKESYIKARGMGLSLALDRFSFDYPHARAVRLAIDPELGDDARRWSFWQLRPRPEYLLAICAERRDGQAPRLTVRKTIPTVADETLEAIVSRTSEPLTR